MRYLFHQVRIRDRFHPVPHAVSLDLPPREKIQPEINDDWQHKPFVIAISSVARPISINWSRITAALPGPKWNASPEAPF